MNEFKAKGKIGYDPVAGKAQNLRGEETPTEKQELWRKLDEQEVAFTYAYEVACNGEYYSLAE